MMTVFYCQKLPNSLEAPTMIVRHAGWAVTKSGQVADARIKKRR